ncbi:MAG: hypothetical protein JSS96_03305 [Bacteroidetes bacterium]|nr:hypothetical protein [Bacteroidota bacterium]
MEKIITVTVNKRPAIIKYKKSTGGRGHVVYSVDTTIPNLSHFKFYIENDKAVFLQTTQNENNIKAEIVKQINENE